jgi:hypothetical protein
MSLHSVKPSSTPTPALGVRLKALVLACLILSATGCMTNQKAQRLDADFEAGWRPSKTYCLFGGETAQLDAYCVRLNFGAEGLAAILPRRERSDTQKRLGAFLAVHGSCGARQSQARALCKRL